MTAWLARNLVVLGDSTAVGLGDLQPDGTWRGVGPLLADAIGAGCVDLDRMPGAYETASWSVDRVPYAVAVLLRSLLAMDRDRNAVSASRSEAGLRT